MPPRSLRSNAAALLSWGLLRLNVAVAVAGAGIVAGGALLAVAEMLLLLSWGLPRLNMAAVIVAGIVAGGALLAVAEMPLLLAAAAPDMDGEGIE